MGDHRDWARRAFDPFAPEGGYRDPKYRHPIFRPHWAEEAVRHMDSVVLGPELAPSYVDDGDLVHVITTLGGTDR